MRQSPPMQPSENVALSPPLWKLITAFTIVYIVWGSTYLAIRFVVEVIPPFFMAGGRFLVAGSILFLYERWRDRTAPITTHNWVATSIAGCLMLVGGNGLVCWSEQYVESGVAALLIATVPLWMILLHWGFYHGPPPTPIMVLGLLVGMSGIYLLIGPSSFQGHSLHLGGSVALLLACVFWSLGSLYSRRASMPKSVLLATSMEMLVAGVIFMVISACAGEWTQVRWSAWTYKAIVSWLYLIFWGSILALSCYGWLLQVTTPARVSTYAYVNPLIALFLGTWFGKEELTWRTGVAASIILLAVVMITSASPKRSTHNK